MAGARPKYLPAIGSERTTKRVTEVTAEVHRNAESANPQAAEISTQTSGQSGTRLTLPIVIGQQQTARRHGATIDATMNLL